MSDVEQCAWPGWLARAVCGRAINPANFLARTPIAPQFLSFIDPSSAFNSLRFFTYSPFNFLLHHFLCIRSQLLKPFFFQIPTIVLFHCSIASASPRFSRRSSVSRSRRRSPLEGFVTARRRHTRIAVIHSCQRGRQKGLAIRQQRHRPPESTIPTFSFRLIESHTDGRDRRNIPMGKKCALPPDCRLHPATTRC